MTDEGSTPGILWGRRFHRTLFGLALSAALLAIWAESTRPEMLEPWLLRNWTLVVSTVMTAAYAKELWASVVTRRSILTLLTRLDVDAVRKVAVIVTTVSYAGIVVLLLEAGPSDWSFGEVLLLVSLFGVAGAFNDGFHTRWAPG